MVSSGLKLINPAGLYDPSQHSYSQIALAPPGGTMVYISGQGGQDENGNLVADFAAQVKQAFANLRTALSAASAGSEHVVKITVLVVEYNEAKHQHLKAQVQAMWGNQPPASTLIPVPRLALDGMLFEIDAIAVIPVKQ